ncbi:MbtH family protein [Actinosynnema sp. CS-041913]|uniref:MbtH family protein n=1 Tax=Actinosynnema sp. CS-041913 TaxID=3239917 RepID=UPI003D8F282A
MFEDEDDRLYTVVRNAEDQYSIWPADRALPPGWTSDGTTGPKSVCLDRIRTVWTDLPPQSLPDNG